MLIHSSLLSINSLFHKSFFLSKDVIIEVEVGFRPRWRLDRKFWAWLKDVSLHNSQESVTNNGCAHHDDVNTTIIWQGVDVWVKFLNVVTWTDKRSSYGVKQFMSRRENDSLSNAKSGNWSKPPAHWITQIGGIGNILEHKDYDRHDTA